MSRYWGYSQRPSNWKELLQEVPEIEPEMQEISEVLEIPAPEIVPNKPEVLDKPKIPAPEIVPLEIPPPPKAAEVVVPNKTEVISEYVNTDSSVTYL